MEENAVFVVVPTYNEAGNIENFLDLIEELNLALDILLIDDNSPDNTWKKIQEYSKFKKEIFERLQNTVQKLPLPQLPEYDSDKILKIIQNDKKIQSGNVRFILIDDIGHAVVQQNINEQSIMNVLEDL